MKEAAMFAALFALIGIVLPMFQNLCDYALLCHLRGELLIATEIAVFDLLAGFDAAELSEARLELSEIKERIAVSLAHQLDGSALRGLEAELVGEFLSVRYRYPFRRLLTGAETWMRVAADYRIPLFAGRE